MGNVEIRTVELTENMVRAIAKQAEAERDRRAQIIHAAAEFQASQTLVNAAQILGSIPAAMQLRYLQTLTEIVAEQNSTIVFPMPIDIVKPFLDIIEKTGKPAGANGTNRIPLMKEGTLSAPGGTHDWRNTAPLTVFVSWLETRILVGRSITSSIEPIFLLSVP